MTKHWETLLTRLLHGLAALFFIAALVLGIQVLRVKRQPKAIAISTQVSEKEKPAEAQNPNMARLSAMKMSKTVVAPTVTAAPKPAAAPLASLIRVKGIMDFGDPKAVEAIIEQVRTNKMANYKVGDTVEGVGAVITKIDATVTFMYDGQTVSLGVNSGESAEAPATAGSNNSPVVAEDRSRTAP